MRITKDIIGLFAEVDEVTHYTKNTRLRLLPADDTGTVDAHDYSHSVIRITLKNGEKYILDLTGAQYGWQETVTPYDIYQQAKIRLIKKVSPFGYTRQFCKVVENMDGISKWHHDVDVGFETVLNDILITWQHENMSLSTLLRLPDDQFEKQQAGLLETLEGGMQEYKQFMTESGAFDLEGGIKIGGLDRKFKDLAGKAIN